jgi:hypothetical protein
VTGNDDATPADDTAGLVTVFRVTEDGAAELLQIEPHRDDVALLVGRSVEDVTGSRPRPGESRRSARSGEPPSEARPDAGADARLRALGVRGGGRLPVHARGTQLGSFLYNTPAREDAMSEVEETEGEAQERAERYGEDQEAEEQYRVRMHRINRDKLRLELARELDETRTGGAQ